MARGCKGSNSLGYKADYDVCYTVINNILVKVSFKYYCGEVMEDCTNGIDDDGDGFVDCADQDCVGHPDCDTAISLVSFAAKAGNDGSITLTWETATEVDNAGFNIYRARTKDGTYKKINATLIPAQDNATSGASYSYVDTPPSKGTYYYKLEDIDNNGVSTMHGPEKVRVRSGDNARRRSR